MSDPHRVSRRDVLRRTGGTLAIGGFGRFRGYVRRRVDPLLAPRVTVMTRNLGLGIRLVGLFDRDVRQVDPEFVHDRYREVLDSAFPTRAEALAAEIADARPALVGLQEAALVRTQDPGDYAGGSSPNAEHVEVDFLRALLVALRRELADRSADATYRPIATVANADEELPARRPDGTRFDVRLTVRDAVLARDDVRVRSTATVNYGIVPSVTLRDGTRITVKRGYCLARVAVGATPFAFANTHLAVSSSVFRAAQASELLGRLAAVDEPVVLVGDFNTGPDTPDATYRTLTDEFRDAHAAAVAEPGPTCCQFATLRNDRSRLGRRVDLVLCRGTVEPLDAYRVGHEPSSRVEIGGEAVWPSDHAGVVADLRVAASPANPVALVKALLSG